MKAVEKMGLLKMDFLGLTTLTIIRRLPQAHRADPRREARHRSRSRPTTPRPSEECFTRRSLPACSSLSRAACATCLRRYKPDTVEDLTALNALYRPGPIQGGMIDDFIERKWGRRKVEYMLPELEGILKETLGVIVYQEQVMQIANVLASYSLGEADLLRRAMGKKNRRRRWPNSATAL